MPTGYPRIVVKWSASQQAWVARCPHRPCPAKFRGRVANGHTRSDVEQLAYTHGEGHHGWGK